MNRSWQLTLFCLIHGLIFLIMFQSGIYGDFKDDFRLEYLYSSRILQGYLPYRDFAVEYPTLGMVFMTLPRLIAADPETYAQAFNVEMMLFDLLGLFVIAALAKRLSFCLWKTLGTYTLALLAIGPIITIRYDLIPAIITLLALYTFIRGNYKTSWALLAVGTLTKVYPCIVAPIFLLYHVRHHSNRNMISGLATFAITSAVIVVPSLFLSPGGFWHSFTYHAQRGLQVESTYASFLLLGQVFGLTSVDVNFSFGSENAVSPLADALAQCSPLIILLSLATIYWFFYKEQKGNTVVKGTVIPITQSDAACVVNYSLLAILTLIITYKALSPQFIIWLYPLIPLVAGRWRDTSWLMLIMIGLMTYFVYPKYYVGLEKGDLRVVGVLFLRNISLIILAFLLATTGKSIKYNT